MEKMEIVGDPSVEAMCVLNIARCCPSCSLHRTNVFTVRRIWEGHIMQAGWRTHGEWGCPAQPGENHTLYRDKHSHTERNLALEQAPSPFFC